MKQWYALYVLICSLKQQLVFKFDVAGRNLYCFADLIHNFVQY